VVAIVTLSSVAARIWLLLHRPLWFDEIFTVWASRLSFRDLVVTLENDSGPPLFYILEKPFVLAGERFFSSDLLARLPSFAATLAVFGGALVLPSRPAKLRFLLLASVSPLLVLYSAEARAYALLSVLVFALFLLAAEARETPARLAAIALLSAALLYTHYLALFAVGAAIAVAAAEKRPRAALAALAGSLLFLFWIPVMARQPRAAVAWMHEPAAELVTGLLSSFGGAGRIPHPFGPPLPPALVALGAGLGLLLAFALARVWRGDARVRRAVAYVVLFFGGVVFASFARPVAFAGRTEMAVLPVWLWTVALAADRSRLARLSTWGVGAVSLVATVLLLSAHRGPAAPRPLDVLEKIARPGDALFTGAHFYLPARLEADRGRLRASLHAFPLSQASHPGWANPTRPHPEDLAAVQRALDSAAGGGRVFFQVPPSYVHALAPILTRRGVVRQIAESPEMVILFWSAR
jgi:hypothetical protein